MNEIVTYDSLDNVWLNEYLFPRVGKKVIGPKAINIDGVSEEIYSYIGQYPDRNVNFLYDYKNDDGVIVEKQCSYHPRIDVIGQVPLSEKCASIIIRVESTESIFYDMWNIDKTSMKPISQVCLYYGYKKDWDSLIIEYVEVESDITKDGAINWHSNQRGLHTYITWKVDEETGLFRVVSQRQEGEFDY